MPVAPKSTVMLGSPLICPVLMIRPRPSFECSITIPSLTSAAVCWGLTGAVVRDVTGRSRPNFSSSVYIGRRAGGCVVSRGCERM